MFKHLVVLMSLVFMSSSAIGNELTAEQASEHLKIPDTLSSSGSFVQYKYFKVLKKPFVSEGRFIQHDNTFEWITNEPIHSSLVFDGMSLWQQSEGGKPKEILLAGHYISVIKALAVGNVLQLSEFFKFEAHELSSCLLLTPKDKQMEMIASSVVFCYDKQLLKVRLNEVVGNHTEIIIKPDLLVSTPKE